MPEQGRTDELRDAVLRAIEREGYCPFCAVSLEEFCPVHPPENDESEVRT